jgi:hypothetical protein
MIVLDSVSRTAIRISVPAAQPDRFGLSIPGIVKSLPDGRWKTEAERLEKRRIEGIEFEGTRITNLSEDQPSLKIVYEWWTSKALGLIGLAIASGRNGKHMMRIERIDWRIPDPGLFIVPSNYIIRDMSLPGSDKE